MLISSQPHSVKERLALLEYDIVLKEKWSHMMMDQMITICRKATHAEPGTGLES